MTMFARNRSLRNWLRVGPATAVVVVFMVLPIGIMLAYSFMEANPYGGVRPSFSTEAYTRLLFGRELDDTLVFQDAYLRIILRSIVLAIIATVAAVLVGFPVAYFIATQPAARRNFLIFLITIPFWTNLLVRTYCWILVLRDQGLINSALMGLGIIDEPIVILYTNTAIVIGLIYTYVPFMILPIYASMEKINFQLVEAAHDLYGNLRDVLRYVIVPLSMPGIVAGCLLVFIPSLSAFIAPAILGGGKNLMLGSLIQLQFASSRNWPFGSALAIVLLALVMLALIYYAVGPARRAREPLH